MFFKEIEDNIKIWRLSSARAEMLCRLKGSEMLSAAPGLECRGEAGRAQQFACTRALPSSGVPHPGLQLERAGPVAEVPPGAVPLS